MVLAVRESVCQAVACEVFLFLKRRIKSFVYLAFVGVVCATMLGLTSCRKVKPDASLAAQSQVVAPGAEGWRDLKLTLPMNSPAVFKLEPSHLIAGLDSTFEWLVKDTAMWGEGAEGEERVRVIHQIKADLFGGFEADPFKQETWSGHGIDITQPVYAAFYPLSSEGEVFVQDVEKELQQRLKLSNDETLYDGLMTRNMEDVNRVGLYSVVDKLRRRSAVALGMRIVLGVDDEPRALDLVDRMFAGDLYSRVARVDDPQISRVYFTDRQEDVMTVAVRSTNQGKEFLIDVFYIPQLEASQRDETQHEVMTHVKSVLASTSEGIASSPAPDSDSSLSLGMNQDGISKILRYMSYTEAIAQASSSAASQRDNEVFDSFGRALWQLNYWDTGAKGIEGISYELDTGGTFENARRMFGFEMKLFGSLEPPSVGAAAIDPGMRESGASISLDPAFLLGKAWKTWLAPQNENVHIFQLIEEFAVGYEDRPLMQEMFYIFASPRLLAQAVAISEDELKKEAPLELMPVYAQLGGVTRVDAVLPGLDLSNAFRSPDVVYVISLSEELEDIDLDSFSAALRDTLYYMSNYAQDEDESEESASEDDSYKRAQPMFAEEVTRFDVPESSPLSGAYYYYNKTAAPPYILLAHGSDAEKNLTALLSKEASLKRRDSPYAFRMKLDPSVILQLSSNYDGRDEYEFLNFSILMQRIGPMLFTVKPGKSGKSGVLEYRFDLLAPPALDGGM